jgi:hypothetical protein
MLCRLFNQKLGVNWSRARFGVKLSIFRLEVEFHIEKPRSPIGSTVRIDVFQMPTRTTFPVINAEERLKTWDLRLVRSG